MEVTTYQGPHGKLSISHSECPYTNLSLESFFLNKVKKDEVHIFLYKNESSVVIGRFQVPWREVNLRMMKQKKLSFVRRRSGGGTVYHDKGNWNFCFLRGNREIEKRKNLEFVQEVLASLGVRVEINDRFDLIYNEKEVLKKVSGSAFKQQKERSYHHGTLLVDADLKSLKGVLGTDKLITVEGKGIRSHPSPVINLNTVGLNISFSSWTQSWVQKHDKKSRVFKESYSPLEKEVITKEIKFLQSWEWLWGETPENKITFGLNKYWFINKKGLVTDASLNLRGLIGKKLKFEQGDDQVCDLEAASSLNAEETEVLKSLFLK